MERISTNFVTHLSILHADNLGTIFMALDEQLPGPTSCPVRRSKQWYAPRLIPGS